MYQLQQEKCLSLLVLFSSLIDVNLNQQIKIYENQISKSLNYMRLITLRLEQFQMNSNNAGQFKCEEMLCHDFVMSKLGPCFDQVRVMLGPC